MIYSYTSGKTQNDASRDRVRAGNISLILPHVMPDQGVLGRDALEPVTHRWGPKNRPLDGLDRRFGFPPFM
jgi:hypothetical protein